MIWYWHSCTANIRRYWHSCTACSCTQNRKCCYHRIRWVNASASADGVCDFSSAPSSRRVGSPSQAPSPAVLPAPPLPPEWGGERITLNLSADYTHTIIACHLFHSVWSEGGCLDSILQRDIWPSSGFLQPLVWNAFQTMISKSTWKDAKTI
jgi:hypothetical protein